jgi:rhodanese-related sulfurtransferase
MSVKMISVAELSSLLATPAGPLNIIDVRTRGEFARVHAVPARSMPLDELDPAAVLAQRASPAEPIYLICQSGQRASQAWQRLTDAGATDVYCVEGGTVAWERMGLPVERGASRMISLERQVRIGAGSLVLLGTVLALAVHPAFLLIPGFVGTGLMFAGITDYCGMAMVLSRMPWNR